jgi:hypothetical protein
MRLTKRVRDGLLEMTVIASTVLEHGGEGWALECTAGPDFTPCQRRDCEICSDYKNLELAVAWLRQFLARKERQR